MRDFRSFFCDAMGLDSSTAGPYEWQVSVATEGLPEILPIPTGLGKTEGAVLGWAWRKLEAGFHEPRHLVYCLPMRTLVRQTVERLDRCFAALAARRGITRVPVFQLIAGAVDDEWVRLPDQPWVLVGTQDQLLSRALNRGYAMSRFDWPMHFGVLNNDCHWIVDEVQLMGPGLWTTSQLDWMRRKRFCTLKPCRTTWMSATVGEGFLGSADRKRDGLDKAVVFDSKLDVDDRLKPRLLARRRIEWFKISGGKRAGPHDQIAARASSEHGEGTLSLIICNTVKSAQAVYNALPHNVPKILLTSRFRPVDRRDSEQRLLAFEERRRKSQSAQVSGDPGLICVSTQVVEAGVDISAHRLWSELAPWPSVVQRLGRLNRDGCDNDAVACFWKASKDGQGPYRNEDLEPAEKLLDAIIPLSVETAFSAAVEQMDSKHQKMLADALRPKPSPLPRAIDVYGLFSTERDLHGGFTDISPFVRNADLDADLTVFWRVWEGLRPKQAELLDGPAFDAESEGCPVAFHSLRDMLKRQRAKAWLWNDEEEQWETCAPDDLRPGMLVMLHRDVGGYNTASGWTGDQKHRLQEVPTAGRRRALAQDEQSEIDCYVALNVHLNDARAEAERICDALGVSRDVRTAVIEAAGLHDIGKAHRNWQSALPSVEEMQGRQWAKFPRVLALDAPSDEDIYRQTVTHLRRNAFALPPINNDGGIRLRWIVDQKLSLKELQQLRGLPKSKWAGHVPFRPGMRHEAASALAMWARYRQTKTRYPALAVYLAAAHHGKVRTVLRSTMRNGDDVYGVQTEPNSLEIDGKRWPMDFSVAADGASGEWTEDGFMLMGQGWTGIVADLLGSWRDREEDQCEVGAVPNEEPRRLGPFALAWLEALVRVADWRASSNPSATFVLPRAPHGE